VKKNKFYFLPESGVAILVGMLIGGVTRLTVTDLTLFSFQSEFFFFVLLPPIIFEAGYSLEKKQFFENIGAITLYAFGGTIISAFVVGMLTHWSAQIGLIHVDKDNPMEALLFGALISAVDPG
jgi:sodium/hydrogen exchanger 8